MYLCWVIFCYNRGTRHNFIINVIMSRHSGYIESTTPANFVVHFYCLVAIMKKFVQLMLHFQWIPWQRVDIFRYSTSLRKKVTFVCKHRRAEEVKVILMEQLQQRHCKVKSFFLIFNSSLIAFLFVRTQTVCISSGKF